MAGSMTEIPVNGDAVPAYISLPPSGSGPAVVVIQEWWGLVPGIRDVADRLAAQGFVAVAPDLYQGKETTEPDEAGKLVMEMQLEQAAKDMAACGRHPAGHARDHRRGVGVIGFCVGGGLACSWPRASPRCRRGLLLRLPPQGMDWDLSAVKAAVLGHFAEDDDFAHAGCRADGGESCATPRSTSPSTTTRAPPAFFNDSRPEVHDAEAAETSWQRTLDFLRAHLGPRPERGDGRVC